MHAKGIPMISEGLQYDAFAPGRFHVGVRTIQALDTERGREFPVEIWYPSNGTAGACPLVLFSHSSGGGRRQSTFLCNHLSSHGYVVAAMDHSEAVAPELARREGETAEQKAARGEAWIANRVPDIRFLLDHLLNAARGDLDIDLDPERIGIAGHSFGGWTALAATEVESRIRAVVALAPAGSSYPKPGILAPKLTFAWGRDVPTLYLVAENDVALPLSGMYELFERTPSAKRMAILRRADHLHFMDAAEQIHEAVRSTVFPGELAWLSGEMKPFAELCPAEEGHAFARGLTLAHLDAVLRQSPEVQRFWMENPETELAKRHIAARIVTAGGTCGSGLNCFRA